MPFPITQDLTSAQGHTGVGSQGPQGGQGKPGLPSALSGHVHAQRAACLCTPPWVKQGGVGLTS